MEVRIEFIALGRLDRKETVLREDLLHSFFGHLQTLMKVPVVFLQRFQFLGRLLGRVRQGEMQDVSHFQQIFAEALDAEDLRIADHFIEAYPSVLRFGQRSSVPILEVTLQTVADGTDRYLEFIDIFG